MTALHVDFETRSAADLKAIGIDLYSRHPTTDAWCMAWAIGDHEPALIAAEHFAACGRGVHLALHHVKNGGIVVAHNAAFELAIWNNVMVPRYGWPRLDPKQVRCTMAMCYAMALPGSLEKAAAAVGIKEQKDLAGGRLMMQMARPRVVRGDLAGQDAWENIEPVWWDDADKLARLYEYCKQDVRVERELEKRLLPLSPQEQAVWQLDYRINQRGFYVDRPAIEAAIKVVGSEKERLDSDIRRATGNFVGFNTENARLTAWLNSRGVDTESVAKAEILDLLADDTLPADCRTALLIRQEAGKTSMAKLDKIVTAVSADGRLRNTLAYHAASTGRWAGRRVQPHNFPRPKIKQATIENILNQLPTRVRTFGAAATAAALDNEVGAPLDVLPWCLRGIITAAPGHDLLGADFANIESRVLAWLAGEEWKLEAFRGYDRGELPDIYIQGYARTFGVSMAEVTEILRQIGKVIELAFGFEGGLGAYRTMEKTYNPPPKKDHEVSEAKVHWRGVHPAIKAYWPAVNNAAIQAVLTGAIIATGPAGRQVKFRTSGSFLWCQIPSGRVLCYPYPRIGKQLFAEFRTVSDKVFWKPFCQLTEDGALQAARQFAKDNKLLLVSSSEPKDALTYMTVPQPDDRKKGKIIDDPNNRSDWVRISTYGGKLVENVTQAVARDLLAEAMLRLDAAGASIVLHVHDEILAEIKSGQPPAAVKEYERIVQEVPTLATGLPIAAKAWRGKRYQKG